MSRRSSCGESTRLIVFPLHPNSAAVATLSPLALSVTDAISIWKNWIPEEQHHVFERGAYFSTEVIPDQLAVISLNTMYWFESNSGELFAFVSREMATAADVTTAVDGCRDRSSDPGALQMDWLEVQLDNFRERGMQVYLIGHVPPHEGLYYDNCCE